MTHITLVGAGLAGLVLADELLSQGIAPEAIRLLDIGELCQGASGAPATLLNPITGRSVFPKDGHLEAYLHSQQWLERLQERFGSDWIHALPTTRAILEDKGGRKARNSFEQAQEAGAYPEWVKHTWLEGEARQTQTPELQCDATLTFNVGYCLMLRTLLQRLGAELQEKGVQFLSHHRLESIQEQRGGGWELHTNHGSLLTEHLVWTVGAGLEDWFPELPLSQTGGELLLGRLPQGVELPYILIRSGHLAPLPDGRCALGSTYRHRPRTEEENDAWVQEWLFSRMEVVFPAVREMTDLEVWSGVRAVLVDNRFPVAGPVPEQSGLWVLGGLASKGVLWTAMLAEDLARQLQGAKSTLPAVVQTTRFERSLWTPRFSP
jgi:tRNA 5-methylaminomethyl-2-thiouridine biosynthesis bifunctional protein